MFVFLKSSFEKNLWCNPTHLRFKDANFFSKLYRDNLKWEFFHLIYFLSQITLEMAFMLRQALATDYDGSSLSEPFIGRFVANSKDQMVNN